MTNWDSHLRPLIGVLSSLRAGHSSVGCDISLWKIDGVERPALVVFGKPWVVWLYIDSMSFMLRGGRSNPYFQPSAATAAVHVGRVGVSEPEMPAKIVALARQLTLGHELQLNDAHSWVDAVRYIQQIEGKRTPFAGNYNDLLKPLTNHAPDPEGAFLWDPAVVQARTRSVIPTAEPPRQVTWQEQNVPTRANSAAVPPAASTQPEPVKFSPYLHTRERHPAASSFTEQQLDDVPLITVYPAVIPAIIGAFFLFVGFLGAPYEFYVVLRWAVTSMAIWMCTIASGQKRTVWVAAFTSVALLFNPLIPINMTREFWVLPDIIGVILFATGGGKLRASRPATHNDKRSF
jgi:hypothetical protein